MPLSRRSFLSATGALAAATSTLARRASAQPTHRHPSLEELDRAAATPILKTDDFQSPVTIASIELLRNGDAFLVRARSTDGAEGLTVPNDDRMIEGYPIFLNRIAPFFIGKDVRDLEHLMWELYRYKDNYKLQGIALWANFMAVETAILDLLGKVAGKSIGDLLGGVRRRDIAVYRASGNRGNTPEAEIDYLRQLLEETGGKALKFRLGGRMSKNADSLPGRSEALIPLVRKTFGDGVTTRTWDTVLKLAR